MQLHITTETEIKFVKTEEETPVSFIEEETAVSFIIDKCMKLQNKASETVNEVTPELCPHDLFSLFTANIIKEKILFTR